MLCLELPPAYHRPASSPAQSVAWLLASSPLSAKSYMLRADMCVISSYSQLSCTCVCQALPAWKRLLSRQ